MLKLCTKVMRPLMLAFVMDGRMDVGRYGALTLP
jgi:hypothetical protein